MPSLLLIERRAFQPSLFFSFPQLVIVLMIYRSLIISPQLFFLTYVIKSLNISNESDC